MGALKYHSLLSIGLLALLLGVGIPVIGPLLETVGIAGAVAFLYVWAISLTLMFVADGRWDVFWKQTVWSVGIILGLFAFIVPGLILWVVYAKRYGVVPALAVLVFPIGAAFIAIGRRWFPSSPPSLAYHTGLGIGIGQIEVNPVVVPLALLFILAALAVMGRLSFVLQGLGPGVHLLIYVVASVALALSLVRLAREPSRLWVVVVIALAALMLGIADILASGLAFVGVAEFYPATLEVSGTEAVKTLGVTSLSLFGGAIFGALFGKLLDERGWSLRKIAIAIAIVVLATLMLMVCA